MAVAEVQQKPSWLKHADFIVLDLLTLAAAFVLAYWLKFGDLGFVSSARWRGLFVMLLLANLVVTLLTGPYSGVFRRSYWEDVGANLKLAIWSFIIACVVFYLLRIGIDYSREMLVVTYVTYLVVGLLLKALLKKVLLSREHGLPPDSRRRVVLVTRASDAARLEEMAHASDMNAIEVVGFCFADASADDGEEGAGASGGEAAVASGDAPAGAAVEPTSALASAAAVPDTRPTAPLSSLHALAAQVNADEVLVCTEPTILTGAAYDELVEDGVRVRFAITEALGFQPESQTLGQAGVMRTLDLERYSFGSGQLLYLPVKRTFDVVFGVVGCVLAVVVAAIVKLCYVASGDSHSIFYAQERIGMRGKPFKLHKLRSMVWNADDELQRLLQDPALHAEWERDQKLEHDPRITPVGRVLRKTSMDELPQFLNVLRGDMSVVGPRPLVPGELEEHGGRQLYNKVRPGITGWWACNGRSNIDYRERLELEYHYVRHCSLYLDILCILRTIVGVLRREGAK